ncbi:DUF4291 domain-containing protein [soil metagenome]
MNKIRAVFDEGTITVYQAYNVLIAESAVHFQKFDFPSFKKDRMTWIKPSFCWMMYRSGWATKKDQERVLAIKIKRHGFDWALRHSCLSHFDPLLYSTYEEWKQKLKVAPVRIQWDPERDINLNQLKTRAIQIGLSDISVHKYIQDWTVEITDITVICREIKCLIDQNKTIEAKEFLPKEIIYPFPSIGSQ